MNSSFILKILGRSQAKENSRQYSFLQTDIFTENSRFVPLIACKKEERLFCLASCFSAVTMEANTVTFLVIRF